MEELQTLGFDLSYARHMLTSMWMALIRPCDSRRNCVSRQT